MRTTINLNKLFKYLIQQEVHISRDHPVVEIGH